MTDEFNLSEKIWTEQINDRDFVDVEDVKEFIKRLKELFKFDEFLYQGIKKEYPDILMPSPYEKIDALAGDKFK